MRELSRPILSPFSADLGFLVCQHASWRARICSQQTHVNPQRRGAHNLSDRFKILENNLRPQKPTPNGILKETTPAKAGVTSDQPPAPIAKDPSEEKEMEVSNRGGSKSILRPKPRTFKGVLIPLKPPPPASDECCMSSCTVCVYDLYATALEDYDEALSHARSELTARSIQPEEWPTEVLPEADRKQREEEQRKLQASEGGVEAGRRIGIVGESDHDRQMAVIIGAFVKFEQALKERRKAERAQLKLPTGQQQQSMGGGSQPSLP